MRPFRLLLLAALLVGLATAPPGRAQSCSETGTYHSYALITGAAIWDIHEATCPLVCNGPEGYAYFAQAGDPKTGTVPGALGGLTGWDVRVWASNFQGPILVGSGWPKQWEWTADHWLQHSSRRYPCVYCQQTVNSPAQFGLGVYRILEDDEAPLPFDDYVGKVQIDHSYCKSDVFDQGAAAGWTAEHTTPGIDDVDSTTYKIFCNANTLCTAAITCPDGSPLSCSAPGTCGAGSCASGSDWVRCGGQTYACGGAPPPPPPPASLPQQPINLVALPVVGGETAIEISWQDRSDNEAGFQIQRVLPRTGAVQLFDVGADETGFLDDVGELPPTGLGPDEYRYRVRAWNAAGRPAWVDVPMATAHIYNTPPGRPDTLNPRGCISTLNPTLSWRGHESSQFYVRLLDASTGEEAMADQTPTTNQVVVPGSLVARRPYLLRVWGMNNLGWGSGSDGQYFVPFCQPVDPPAILAPLGCTANLTPTVSWTPVANALYYVLRIHRVVDISNDPEVIPGGVGPTGTSWTFPAGLLQPGQEYRIKVKAFTGTNTEPYSVIRFFTPQCNPSSPPGTASGIAPDGGTVPTAQPTYTWFPGAQAESYLLEAFTPGWQLAYSGTVPAAGVCDGTTCSFRPSQPLADGTYSWHVQGSNAFGSGLASPWATFTVADQTPDLTVTGATVTEGNRGTVAAQFTVQLTHPAPTEVSFDVATANASAVAPYDYQSVSRSVAIPAGQSQAVVSVLVQGDPDFEGTETFTLNLSNVLGAHALATQAVGTILDDDPPPKAALFLSQTVPTAVGAGHRFTVSLTVKNAGSLPWDPVGPSCKAFRLGSANPYGNNTWGLNRVELPAPVPPGGQVTLNFSAVAPLVPGLYPFQWRMVHECEEWFGDLSPAVVVTVG